MVKNKMLRKESGQKENFFPSLIVALSLHVLPRSSLYIFSAIVF